MDDMTPASPESISEPPADSEQEKRIEKIISKGRRTRPGGWTACFLLMLSALLSYLSFTPVDAGPLAWICLVPLLLLTRTTVRPGWMYRSAYVVSLIYWLATLQWMRLGDPSMYIALFALAGYLACLTPLFLLLTRGGVLIFRAPLILVAPVYWVGLEYLRAYLFTGFSWYYLGHTQHNWVEIIQISDLVGSYGVSFLVVMANAAITQAIPQSWIDVLQLEIRDVNTPTQEASLRTRLTGVAVSVGLILCALLYGYVRRANVEFAAGPRVALIQGNFTASLKPDTDDWDEIFRMHHALTGQTVPYQPDLIVWPEAMFRYPLMEHDQKLTDEKLDALHPMIRVEDWKKRDNQRTLSEIADKTDAALIIGVNVYEAESDGYSIYNSAAFVEPHKGMKERYDKIHRVPFGEYIPFRDQVPLIQSLTPFRGDFGIDAGNTVEVFEYKDWDFLPMICFEDTVPHLVRSMVQVANQKSKRPVDLLVNVTNDGWFHGSSELDQHLITSSFRAVETRTPLVRAVNTGISAFIDGDGVIRTPDEFIDFDSRLANEAPRESIRDPRTGRFYRQLNCALVADIPLDPRGSLYVRFGDWFAAACLVASIAVGIQLLFKRQLRLGPQS